jgi:hypothetical protein
MANPPRKTVQEIASGDYGAKKEWIHTETDPRKLEEFALNFPPHFPEHQHARIAIEILLAESAQRLTQSLIQLTQSAERQSRRLIQLTWALVVVSVALLAFALAQTAIMLKEDAATHAQQVQSSQGKPTGSGQH